MSAVNAPTEYPCAACGYPLRGLTVGATCPECGTPVLVTMRDNPAIARTSGWAITSLVLGILSVLGCVMYGLPSVVLGPVAILGWWMTRRQLQRSEAGGSSRGLALAGLICGIVGSLLGGAFVVFVIVMAFSMTHSLSSMPPPVQPGPGYQSNQPSGTSAPGGPIIYGGSGQNPTPQTPPGARSVPPSEVFDFPPDQQ